MGQEQQPSPLRHIHVDLENWSVILEGADGRAISFNPSLLLQRLLSPTLPELSPTAAEDTSQPEVKEATVKLAGKLKSVPKDGSPDRSGYPTVWARFAAHEEGSQRAHLYLATFHRKARDIAQYLEPDAPIIVEGYPHPATDPGKSDTLSVVHIIDYPGKPKHQGNAD
jgi:hypothetical protein